MKKVFWWAGHSRNFGDLVLIQQQKQLIQSLSKEPIEFIPLCCHTKSDGTIPEIDAALLEQINAEGDMLMVGSGGQILPDLERHGNWLFNIREDLIKKIQVPLVLYGIGVNIFKYQKWTHKDQQHMWRHINLCCEKADLVSVRDSITKSQLKKHNVKLIGDPAYLLSNLQLSTPSYKPKNKHIVGIVWGGDRFKGRYGPKNVKIILKDLADNIKTTFPDSYVICIPHTALWDVADQIFLESQFSQDKVIPISVLPDIEANIPKLLNAYKLCDFVISSRWHGVVIPAALGIPVLPFGNNAKQVVLSDDVTGVFQSDDFLHFIENCKFSENNLTTIRKKIHNLNNKTINFTKGLCKLL